jgi:hypothetical protein
VLAGALEEFGGFSLDDSKGGGEGVSFGLTEKEVDVLGHENVGVEGDVVGSAGTFDEFLEDVFWFGGSQVGKAVVTTESDEMELACVLAAFEAQWHGWILSVGEGRRFAPSRECPIMR